jgi:hypothetical protein
MSTFRDVDPSDLRLPPARQNGAIPSRYRKQVTAYGANTSGMPIVEVTEGRDGELMINNGVTRAMRISLFVSWDVDHCRSDRRKAKGELFQIASCARRCAAKVRGTYARS